MNPINVTIDIDTLHCFDEGDGWGSAEPYVWTVFFKIDGSTTRVDSSFRLQGRAFVQGSVGDHGSLPNHDVDAGETVPIPSHIGEFRTILRPISLDVPVGSKDQVGGAIGCIVVVMEEDNTSARAVAQGHQALNRAVQRELDNLIRTLGIVKPEPTDEDIASIEQKVAQAVTKAIADHVSTWDWIKAFGNMDDKIGTAVFRFSHSELERSTPTLRILRQRWRREGDWEIRGEFRATAA